MSRRDLACLVLALAVALPALPSDARAQVPERVRLDLSLAMQGSDDRVITGPLAAFWTDREKIFLVGRVDLSATVNVSSRLSVSFGVPVAAVVARTVTTDQERERRPVQGHGIGLGDFHLETNLAMIGERRLTPGVSIGVDVGAPTATTPLTGARA